MTLYIGNIIRVDKDDYFNKINNMMIHIFLESFIFFAFLLYVTRSAAEPLLRAPTWPVSLCF